MPVFKALGRAPELEEGLHDIDDVEVGVDDGQGAPLVEGEAGVADVEGEHVARAQVVGWVDAQVGVLVHQFGYFPVRGGWSWGCCAGTIVKSRDGEAGVECRIALAHTDDGARGLGHGLNAGPDVERGQKLRVHAVGDGIGVTHAGVRFAVGTDVVGEVAAGTKDDVDGVAEAGAGEFFGDHVKPCGAGAGENWLAVKTALREKIADG